MKILGFEFGKRASKPTMKRYFEAAKVSRLSRDWSTSILTADAVLEQGLKAVRGRSRDLAYNDPIMRRYLKLLKANVIGSKGIRFQSRVMKAKSEKNSKQILDAHANRRIEAAFADWSKKSNCTVSGKLSFRDVQNMAIEGVRRDGEVFIRRRRGAEYKYGFALQLLEADMVDEFHNEDLQNGNRIRMGIEINADGRPLFYHFLTSHPGETRHSTHVAKRRVRIPADQIYHIHDPDRITQTRGYPDAVAGMKSLRMLHGYTEAELVASRAAAQKMGIIYSPDGEGYDGDTDEDGNITMEAEAGTFDQLPKGWKMEMFDPQHPVQAFGEFVKAMGRMIASSLSAPFADLFNDYSDASYSSLRAAALTARDEYKHLQTLMIEHFCEPIFEDWLTVALLTPNLNLPFSKFDKFNAPFFRPRGFPWVDPVKDIDAATRAIDARLNSRTRVLAEKGEDFFEIVEELSHENELLEANGMSSKQTPNNDAITKGSDSSSTDASNADASSGKDTKSGKKSKAA